MLIYGEDKDGDGVPRQPDRVGTAFGQDDAEFNIFNTDRQLSALQTAVTMLRPLPEQKSLVYFASGLRLNGTDNQAQLRATINAAIRANVAIYPGGRARAGGAWRRSATRRSASPGGVGDVHRARLATAVDDGFQRSQDTLYALAKDTGGKAMFDYNDLSLGIVQAAEAHDQLLHHRLLQHAHRPTTASSAGCKVDAGERPRGASWRTARGTSPTRSSRSSTAPTRSGSSRKR